ncbi:hypothetical protein [Deinococcus hohokamensis]|uniref:FG-GAP repeat protein n=1 Tax=Deinococcus hohokamensis TaxID=309883 RepID=A0ABV9I7S6_9DEIO
MLLFFLACSASAQRGTLLYDPLNTGVAFGQPANSPVSKTILAAPAAVTAYCEPGTLGKLGGEDASRRTYAITVNGQFTRKVPQRATLMPVCSHKSAKLTLNWIYGVAVTDLPAFGAQEKAPILVFYIVGSGTDYGTEAGGTPVPLGDLNGDGLNELGLLHTTGDGGQKSVALQVYQLSPSPAYLTPVLQAESDDEDPGNNYAATIYAVPTKDAPTYVGIVFGPSTRVYTLPSAKQDLRVFTR